MTRILLLFVLLFAVAPAAGASETEPVAVSDTASIRLISAGKLQPDGTVWAGIAIDMPSDTSTYWRVPGETGVPMVMDWSASQNLGGAEIFWPMPRRVVKSGYTDYVYEGNTVFPVQLRPTAGNAVWSAHLLLGICNEVCIPVSVDLELPLATDAPDMASNISIRQAMATVPLALNADDLLASRPEFDPEAGMLTVRLKEPIDDPRNAILATADPALVFAEPEFFPDYSLRFRLLSRTPEKLDEQETLDFLFDTTNGPQFVTSPFDILGRTR
ncbi:MAG: hypothetical protein H6873_06535 [Hyphomicrobiaceae bacterium]|nr:hypothetical protein [Hyphomicrobiaceae bacterium]